MQSLRLFSRTAALSRPGATVRRVAKIAVLVLVALIVVGLGVYAWASFTASRKLSRTYTVHTVDFPIPFPLPEEEVRRLQLIAGVGPAGRTRPGPPARPAPRRVTLRVHGVSRRGPRWWRHGG